jgi:hypothetical protein
MRPSAAFPMGQHLTVPLIIITLSFPSLDGKGLPTTETTPEVILEDRRSTKLLSASGGPCQWPNMPRPHTQPVIGRFFLGWVGWVRCGRVWVGLGGLNRNHLPKCLEGSERSKVKERLGADPVRIFKDGQRGLVRPSEEVAPG